MRYGLTPIIITSKRRDPKTGKISIFQKKVWVNPIKLKELKKQKHKKIIEIKPDQETIITPKLSQEKLTSIINQYDKLFTKIAHSYKKHFYAFDLDDIRQQAILGAIMGLQAHPEILQEKEQSNITKFIISHARKAIQEYITENAETLGISVKYKQKIDNEAETHPESRYEKVAQIVPLLDEESEDETERMFGRKMTKTIWNLIEDDTIQSQEPDIPYRVIFFEIAEKYLSPLEIEAYRRVKIENESLRVAADALNISYVGVKKAAERAEKKMGKILSQIAKVKTFPIDNTIRTQINNIKQIYKSMTPEEEAVLIYNRDKLNDPKELEKILNEIQSQIYTVIIESNTAFIYYKKELKGIVDYNKQRIIDV